MSIRILKGVSFTNTAGMPTALLTVPLVPPTPPAPWDPSALNAAMLAWYEMSSNATVASGRLSGLGDLSPAGRNLTSSGTQEPLYTVSAQNGLAAISADSTVSASNPNCISGAALPSDINTPFSLVLAFRKGSNTLSRASSLEYTVSNQTASATNSDGWSINTSAVAGTPVFAFQVRGGDCVKAQTPLVAGDAYIGILTYNGSGCVHTNFAMAVNNVPQTVVPTGNFDTDGFTTWLASGQSFALLQQPVAKYQSDLGQSSDQIFAYLHFNRVLTAPEQANLFAYLNGKLAIY